MRTWQAVNSAQARLRRLGAAALLVCSMALALPPTALAQDVPWRRQMFDLQATNEPLNVFLTRLLTLHGLPASMSPAVASGRVSGRFKGQAEAVFRELAETYGLIGYFDGVTLHVCSLAELDSRLLQVDPSDVPRIERTLKQMRLSDGRFPLRISASEGQVLVSGPPRYVELVADVVGRVADTPSLPKMVSDVRIFRLKYARAADSTVVIGGVDTLIPGVASILNDIVGSAKDGAPQANARSTLRTVPGLRGKGQRAVGRGGANNAANTGAGEAGTTAAAANAITAALNGLGARADSDSTGVGATAMATLAGSTLGLPQRPLPAAEAAPAAPQREAAVRADPRLNAIIVRDMPDRMAMYARLIEALDVDVPLMEIEATVIDVADDKSEQLGIDWRANGERFNISSSPNGLAGTGANPRNSAGDLLPNPAGGLISAGSGLVGTLLFGSSRSYFLTRLNALAEKGDAKLISRPRVLTLDNTEAVLQSTREFYVRVAGRDQVDLFNVSLGLMMRVTPTLIDDAQGKRFKLQVRIEDGNTNSGAQVDQIPVVNRNAISTQAVVGDGQSMLIGGYMIEERRDNKSGVPGLSDVPILGWLFGQKGSSVSRVERLFMITPRLVSLNSLPLATVQPPEGGAAVTATAGAPAFNLPFTPNSRLVAPLMSTPVLPPPTAPTNGFTAP